MYNGAQYLRHAVDSILNQTFKDFEYIIINDGSSDGTKEILDSFHDSRLRIIHQENIGLTDSLNKAIGLARGAYIARMDADDISAPGRLEKEAAFLDANPAVGLVGSLGIRIDENGTEGHLLSFPTDNGALKNNLEFDCPFLHGSVMYRKACIDKIGPYRKKIGPAEDYDLWRRIAEHYAIANLDEPLYKYRVVAAGVSMSLRFNQVRGTLLVRKLANDRKTSGKDALDDMSDAEVEKLLDSLYPASKRNKRNVLYAQYAYLADISYFSGDYARACVWLARAIALKPLSRRCIVLAFKTMLASILPGTLIKKTKEKYKINAHGWN